MDHRAVSHDRNLAAIAEYFSLADFQQLGLDINGTPTPLPRG